MKRKGKEKRREEKKRKERCKKGKRLRQREKEDQVDGGSRPAVSFGTQDSDNACDCTWGTRERWIQRSDGGPRKK